MRKILILLVALGSLQLNAQVEQPKIKLNQIIKDTIGGRFLMSSFTDSSMTYESILTTDGTSIFLNGSLFRPGYWQDEVDYLSVADTLLPIKIPIIDDDSIDISDNISGDYIYGVPLLNGSVPHKSGMIFFDPADYLSVTVAPPNVGTLVGSRGLIKYVAPDFQDFSQQYTSYAIETLTSKWYVDKSIDEAKKEILFNDIIQDAGINLTQTGDSIKISIDTIYIVTTAALFDSLQNRNPSLLLDSPNYIYQVDSIKTFRLNALSPDSINLTGTPPGSTGPPNFDKIVDPREGQVFYDAEDITGNTLQLGKGTIKYVATSADLSQFRIETLVTEGHLGSVLGDYVTLASGQTITGEKTFTANTVFDDSTMVVDVTNHRVGFNTTSPITALDVNGIASSNEGFAVYTSLVNSNYGYNNSWSNGIISLSNSFLLYGPSAGGTFLGQSLAGASVLKTGSSSLLIGSQGAGTNTILGASGNEVIRIASDGNVGIGNTNPTEKLSITGKINLNDGDDNVVVGDISGTNLISSSGLGNVLIGAYTGNLLEDGDYNVALGHYSLFWNVSGRYNVSLGTNALENNLANNNIAVGSYALAGNTTGTSNIGIGVGAGNTHQAGTLTSGTGNMFIGNATSASANGVTNEVVIGTNAVGNGSNTVTLGASNTISLHTGNYEFNTDQTVGAGTDNYVLTYDNTGGQISLENVTNLLDTTTIVTTKALNDTLTARNYVTTNTTQTITGAKTFTNTFTQSGGNANFDSGTLYVDATNNRVGIGTTSPTTALEVNGTITGTTFVETSSIRYKTNVEDIIDTEMLNLFRPVTYTLKQNNSNDLGFIAEEVYDVYKDLVVLNDEGKPESIKYTKFIPLIIKRLQEQDIIIKNLENKIKELENK